MSHTEQELAVGQTKYTWLMSSFRGFLGVIATTRPKIKSYFRDHASIDRAKSAQIWRIFGLALQKGPYYGLIFGLVVFTY